MLVNTSPDYKTKAPIYFPTNIIDHNRIQQKQIWLYKHLTNAKTVTSITTPNTMVCNYNTVHLTLLHNDYITMVALCGLNTSHVPQGFHWYRKVKLGKVKLQKQQELGECTPPPIWKFLVPPNRKSMGQSGSLMIFCIQAMKWMKLKTERDLSYIDPLTVEFFQNNGTSSISVILLTNGWKDGRTDRQTVANLIPPWWR